MKNTTTEIKKLEEITKWFAENAKETPMSLSREVEVEKFQKIETLLGEPLPKVFKAIYQKYNGESGEGMGTFMGHAFLSLDEIISSLEFSKTLVKPLNRQITNPEASQKIIDQILTIVKPVSTNWYKITGSCGPQSISGPYLYPAENSTGKERKSANLERSQKSQVMELCNQLHDLEYENYNWDELEFTIYADGRSEIKRTDYNFDEELPLTSTPPDAIKLKYFHFKWLPVFSDGGGNYIGFDLDPDTKGIKNQIIVFGRDEEDMFVLANDLDQFFDRCLSEIAAKGEELLNGVHLHDYFKEG